MLRGLVFTCAVAVLVAGAVLMENPRIAEARSADDKPRFDVSDISYLWPVPKTQADVDALISADTSDPASMNALWDEAAFKLR